MHLRSLHLRQFRQYGETHFEFHPTLNLICGPNAQGKTTILEAIHCLMIGRSFRQATQRDLIQMGTHAFYLEAIFHKHGVDQQLRLYTNGTTRHIHHNDTLLPNLSHLVGLMQGAVMTPDDVHLVKGPPLARRQFLDLQLAQANPLYLHHLSRYVKAMRQRNQLLKDRTTVSIESWEYEMAHAAAYLHSQRRIGVEALHMHAATFHSYLTKGTERLSLEYRSDIPQGTFEHEMTPVYLAQFQKNRPREMALGYTLHGPHKDDIWIGINGVDVRHYASEGQQRSCTAALHVGAWERLKETTTEAPLVMIDDVGISLDGSRRERLLDRLLSLGQLFVTTTDLSLLESFKGPKKTFLLPLGHP